MHSKFLTYFLGFSYEECTLLNRKGDTIEALTEVLTPLLLPDTIQAKKRLKCVVFRYRSAPYRDYYQSREIYYVYQVKSVIYESDLSKLITRYYIDMPIKLFSFGSGILLILLSTLLLFQKLTGVDNRFYNFVQNVYFLIPVFIVLKSIVGYHIYVDIESYREKLSRI